MKARGKIMTAVCLAVSGVLFLLVVGRSGGATADLALAGKSNAGEYVVVDDFDSYQNLTELFSVWNDSVGNNSGAQIFLDKDPNFVRDGNSVILLYQNSYMSEGRYVGSWMDANPAELEIGADWTVSGANRLVVYFRGDALNSAAINNRMWVELEDTSSNVGLVLYGGDANDLTEEWWHEWNIDLWSFDALGVQLTEVGSVAIGFGGYERTGQTADGGTGYVWFDDIRLCGDGGVMPGLIAHWKFDEGTGVTAYDSAGDNDGTIYGAAWTTGQIDGGLEFDGLNDYVDLGNDASLKPSLPVTVSAWVNLSGSGKHQRIISIDEQSLTTYYGFWLHILSTDRVRVGFGDGRGGGSQAYRRSKIGTTILDTSTWYHVAAVIRGATDMDVYVNGVDDAGSYEGSGGSLAYSSGFSHIGRNARGTNYFDGAIDDVRIYGRALSGGEIQELYKAGLGDMVAHWTFDEGSGTIAYDSAGDDDGTIHGATWTTGVIGGALEFDGVDDYVDCGNGASINSLSAFSVSMWFKADVVCGPMHRHLIAQRDLGDIVWTLILHRDYSCRLTGRVETSGTPAVGRSNFIPEVGQWYHAAMTYDDAGDRTLRVYVDGVEQSYMLQTPATGTILFDPSVSIAIGNRIGGGKEFDGIIDDVMIFKRALSAAEVEALYQGGLVNAAPVACVVGGDRVVEAGGDCEGRVVLDGSCSSDADSTEGTNDDINDFDWYEVVDACEPNSDIYIGSGEVIECNLGLGEHLIVLEVTDKAGAFDSNEVVITVEDVTPPEFSLVVEPNILWPPNGKLVEVRPEWEVSDNCDEEVEVSLVDISMNVEGDINNYVEMGDDGSIYLRARKGGSGRIYTLTYEAVDDSGNVAEASATVTVPHNRGPRKLPGRSLKNLDGRLRRQVYRRGVQREGAKK